MNEKKPKIALCLSGQLRFVREGYNEVINPFVLNENNIDVFIHTWQIEDDQVGKPFINGGGFIQGDPVSKQVEIDAICLYKPVRHIIEKQIPFEFGKYAERSMPGNRSDHQYSMFYSIFKSNELKKEYEKQNNFTYDFVIRSRFDVKLNSKVDFTVPDDKMYLPSGCFDPYNGYVDCFGYSNSKLMDIYSDLYNNIDNIMATTIDPWHCFCGEYLLRRHIDSHKINVEQNYWHSLFGH